MRNDPQRAARRWHLIGGPVAIALAVGASGALTACEPVRPPRCFGEVPTRVGTPGHDALRGTEGRDVIVGLGGDDVIHGLGGDDRICAGAGRDQVHGMDGADSIDGDAGSDHLDGGGQDDRILDTSTDPRDVNDLRGAAGDDLLQGGGGRDRADHSGSAGVAVTVDLGAGTATGLGADRLRGIDAVIGGSGEDLLYGTSGADGLDGRGGVDLLVGRGGDDTLIGGAGSDWIDHQHAPGPVTVDLAQGRTTGGDGRDRLIGVENVQGSRFADLLIGDPGPNHIEGYEGTDTCRGGGGTDIIATCP